MAGLLSTDDGQDATLADQLMGKDRGRMIDGVGLGRGYFGEHFQAVSAGFSSSDDRQDATLADQLKGKYRGKMNSSRGSLYDT